MWTVVGPGEKKSYKIEKDRLVVAIVSLLLYLFLKEQKGSLNVQIVRHQHESVRGRNNDREEGSYRS